MHDTFRERSLRKAFVVSLLGLWFVLASSCALIGDRTSEYKVAEESERIRIPAGLSESKLGERYAIPTANAQSLAPGKYVLPEPPDATASISEDPYILVKHDGSTWLELNVSPSKAWPLIELFWQQNGLASRTKRVEDGYFATEELKEGQSHADLVSVLESNQHQPIVIEGVSFQARLTQGLRRNTSELQVRAFLPDASSEARETWQDESITPSLERALLEVIGEHVISRDQSSGRYSLNAVNIGDQSRLRLLEDQAGYPYIRLALSFDRAWKEVNDALSNSEIIVSSVDKDQGLVFISYLSQEEIDSWYTLGSTLKELKVQKNLELKFYAEGPETINVRAKVISEIPEPDSVRELIKTLFSLIS